MAKASNRLDRSTEYLHGIYGVSTDHLQSTYRVSTQYLQNMLHFGLPSIHLSQSGYGFADYPRHLCATPTPKLNISVCN